MSLSIICHNGGVYGFLVLLICASSVPVFIKRQVRSAFEAGCLFIILGIIALAIGVLDSKAGLAMANSVIHGTKGAADPTQVDQAYTATATTTVLVLAVLVVDLIFLLIAIVRGGSSTGGAS